MSATELAALIRSRQVPVREVIQTHLQRLDTVNPALNAIVIRLDEQAIAATDAADRAVAAGDRLPPLHGVPSPSRSASTSPAPRPRPAGRCWQITWCAVFAIACAAGVR
jgi:Amidase